VQLSLADRTVLVTGGGSGIGKGVAAAVVAAGGKAMLVGRNADRLSGAADEIAAQAGDGEVRYEPADVTNEDEVARVVEAARGRHAGGALSSSGRQFIDTNDEARRTKPGYPQLRFYPQVGVCGAGRGGWLWLVGGRG